MGPRSTVLKSLDGLEWPFFRLTYDIEVLLTESTIDVLVYNDVMSSKTGMTDHHYQ